MELPRLVAKQKRLIDVLRFTKESSMDPAIKSKLLKVLDTYRAALTATWRTPEKPADIDSIERELEVLFNDARLRTTQP